jgi:hypothetical protein
MEKSMGRQSQAGDGSAACVTGNAGVAAFSMLSLILGLIFGIIPL